MSVISIENLKKSFTRVIALDGISFDVSENKIVGFLGPNGAGKTTTIGILMQMIKADEGNVYLFGNNIRDEGHKIRQRVGLIPDASLPPISGKQLLKHTGWHYGHSGNELKERIENIIETIGGSTFYERNTKTLSKGQRQRIKIANALLPDPELIIADEPTSGLDPVSRRTLLNLFSKLVHEEGKSIFFSNHVISEVEKVSDYLIILNRGKIQTQGTMEEIKQQMTIPGMYSLNAKNISENQLKDLPGVENVTTETVNNFIIRTREPEAKIPRFLKELVDMNIQIEGFSKKQVELEDIL